MTAKTAKYALKCLSAADIAPDLAEKIQYLYAKNLREARESTIQQGRVLVEAELGKLPSCFDCKLDHDELTELVCEFIDV